MRRGTRVAEAVIRATVDGSGINEEIVDSVHAAGPGVEKEGEEAGDRYGEGFSSRFRGRMDGMRDKIGARLSASLGKSGEQAGDEAGKSFTDRMGERVRTMGDKIGSELSDRMASHPEQIRRGIDRAFDDNFADSIGRRIGDKLGESLTRHMADSIMRDAGKIEAAIGEVSGNRQTTRRAGTGDDKSQVAEIVARLFGRGSRNNFLNIIGASAGGLVNTMTGLLGVVGKVQSGATTLFKTFQTGFINANGAADALSGILGGAGAVGSKLFTSLAESGPAALGVIAAISAAMVILVSVASALLAVVVALASTIASALVGALAVASGGMVALGGAAGLATLAFMSMDNTQKALLSTAFRPLHQEAIGLGQTMLTQLVPAFSVWSGNLQRALALAQPLAAVMGGAFARAGSILTAALSGPGVQMLLVTLSTTLPGIVTHLSGALGGFINGLAGMFSAIMPFVLQFSIYLEHVALTFANWATSAQGQNAIVDFVSRALVALDSRWGFVSAIGGLIAAVFFSPSAQEAGNNIFDSMAGAVRRLTAYLQQDDRMQRWFAEGLVFAQALGDAIVTLAKVLSNLNSSGIIDGIAKIADIGASAYSWWSKLPGVVQDMIMPMKSVADLVGYIGSITGSGGGSRSASDMQSDLGGLLGEPMGMSSAQVVSGNQTSGGRTAAQIQAQIDSMMAGLGGTSASLQASGGSALANTYQNAGGYLPNPTKPKPVFHNPWKKWAESLIKQGPGIAAQIRNALLTVNKQIASAVQDATRATSGDAVAQSMTSLINSNMSSAAQTVNTAQSAVNSAAQTLANATSMAAAKRAKKGVKRAQANLAAAKRDQRRIANANKILAAQEVVHQGVLSRIQATLDMGSTGGILNLLRSSNATLADYAEARAQVAQALDNANQKLAEAIQIRDQYRQQIADSIKSFGALTTAQAKVIDGVTQALTATDITDNLQARLDQITHFQNALNQLLGMGLSNDAYKQILDMGVEGGTQYADALLNGGIGSIQQTNQLTDQINGVADSLGLQASDRLYQAGVNAAQGLVDGLTSLSAQLDSAATQLGNSIAEAVKRALGIHSPSRVMAGLMDYVGDGAVDGLDAQHVKVGNAAARLAGQIAVSPEVAQYAARQGETATVSGNDGQKFRDLIVHTPTEDPKAVAHEVLNELIGRL